MALVPVAEALAQVLDGVGPLPAEDVAVGDAFGRVLAADLTARRTQPPDDVSAMDGYAARAEDVASLPARLRLVGEVAAGRPLERAIGQGETARILTGGVLPKGADTIVIQENVRRDGDAVIVEQGAAPRGRHVRPKGLDFAEGSAVLAKGRRLTTRDLAVAAAANHATVPVHCRPKVAIASTGDELVPVGTVPGPGQIVSSNGLSLTALARAEGADALDLGNVPDTIEDTVAAIRRARAFGADILVTTGGASVGDYDLVQPALAAEGMRLSFWKIAMRPGKPLMHGRLGAARVLGLPGNPVSSYVCSVLFLVPLIRRMLGRGDLSESPEPAILGRDLPKNDEREDYLRASLVLESSSKVIATPFPTQDSSMMSVLANADCLVIREPFADAAPAGSPCRILKLRL